MLHACLGCSDLGVAEEVYLGFPSFVLVWYSEPLCDVIQSLLLRLSSHLLQQRLLAGCPFHKEARDLLASPIWLLDIAVGKMVCLNIGVGISSDDSTPIELGVYAVVETRIMCLSVHKFEAIAFKPVRRQDILRCFITIEFFEISLKDLRLRS